MILDLLSDTNIFGSISNLVVNESIHSFPTATLMVFTMSSWMDHGIEIPLEDSRPVPNFLFAKSLSFLSPW
jgi:hypothetical protein